MARTARVALPEDDYLTLIGQVAYMVSSLEWTILGDLPGLAQYLPPDLTASVLAGKSTGQIARTLSKAVGAIGDDDVRAYRRHAATGARLQPGVRSPAQGGGPQGDHARKAATLQHLSDACGRHCRRCGGRLARPYRADDTSGVRKGHRRSDHRRCGGVLASGKPGLGNLDPARAFG